ncbi:MAG: O-methyltransferase [Bdellovibrionales bacterium]|nr:O-methyltransferase [Bdellovibrionales bacterium]
MDKSFGNSDEAIGSYVYKLLGPEDQVLEAARKEGAAAGMPAIQVGGLDGRHLEVFAAMSRAQKVVEIGTLAGYSGICLLRGMNPSGHLYTFEWSPLHAQVALRNFKMAGVENRVTLYVGEALERLPQIESEGPFDLVFIDADKGNYPAYLEWAEKNLRSGGVVVGDNTFAFGRIAQEPPREDAPSVMALRKFNAMLAESPRWRTTIFPTGEGLTVGVKR